MRVEHRGVLVERSSKGFWILVSTPPGTPYNFFSNYFTLEEIEQTSPGSKTPLPDQALIIKEVINRLVGRFPVYTGDIRERTK